MVTNPILFVQVVFIVVHRDLTLKFGRNRGCCCCGCCCCCCHWCFCCCYHCQCHKPNFKVYSKFDSWDISVIVFIVLLVVIIIIVVLVVYVVIVDPRNLHLKFGPNRVSNSRDIAEVEFLVVGGGVQSFSCQTQLLSWVVVECGLWQHDFDNGSFLI